VLQNFSTAKEPGEGFLTKPPQLHERRKGVTCQKQENAEEIAQVRISTLDAQLEGESQIKERCGKTKQFKNVSIQIKGGGVVDYFCSSAGKAVQGFLAQDKAIKPAEGNNQKSLLR